MSLIFLAIALRLDGILSAKIPSSSFFLPLLTLTTLFLIYPRYQKKSKKYFCLLITTGLIYDLLYTNLLFFHALIFLFLGLLIKYIYKNCHQNIFKHILYLIFIIAIYEITISSILFIFQTTTITISKLIYEIVQSLLLNIMYALLLTPLLKYKHN